MICSHRNHGSGSVSASFLRLRVSARAAVASLTKQPLAPLAPTAEQLPVPTATSLAALGVRVTPQVIDSVLADYLAALGELLGALLLEDGDAVRAGVHAEVEALCGTLGTAVRVHLPDGSELVGEALRLGSHGELIVGNGADETSVIAGDVVHVR